MTPAQEMLALRKELFGLIIPDTRGMSVRRVYRHLSRHGFPITPWIAVGPADRARFTRACYDTGLIGNNILNPAIDGISLFSLQFSIVFRDTPPERQLGSDYAETTLVHELVHGSGSKPEYLSRHRHGQIIQSRLGLIIDGKGHFFEEFLAETIQDSYTETALFQKWSYDRDALPSTGLQPIVNRDPRLLPAVKRAHLGGRLEEVEIIIDQHGGPGLFQYLYNLEPGEESFAAGNAEISRRLNHSGRRITIH